MQTYRKKPDKVKGVELSYEVKAFQWEDGMEHPCVEYSDLCDAYYLFNGLGYVEVNPGDWIVIYPDNYKHCHEDEIFRKCFDLVEE